MASDFVGWQSFLFDKLKDAARDEAKDFIGFLYCQ